jgi:uncharacterized protein YifE (UPF0438 family)
MDIIEFEDGFLNLKEKFQVENLRYTKIRLTGRERKLLEKHGTRLQAFADGSARSTSDEYLHFMKVHSREADAKTPKEHAWLKYQSMLENNIHLREASRQERIQSPERDEYIRSRLVP